MIEVPSLKDAGNYPATLIFFPAAILEVFYQAMFWFSILKKP